MTEAVSGPGVTSQSRNWAMAAHLTAVAGALLGGLPAFVGPLVIWLVKRDEDPYVADHAKESLNFQIFTILAAVAGGILFGVLTLVTFGLGLIVLIPLAVIIGAGWLALTIIAAVKAANGEVYRYPVNLRLIS